VKYVARSVGLSEFGTAFVTLKKTTWGGRQNVTRAQHSGGVHITREVSVVSASQRKVIIATIEYNIDDWNIKVKTGDLGVVAQPMGKALSHLDLIWVVPSINSSSSATLGATMLKSAFFLLSCSANPSAMFLPKKAHTQVHLQEFEPADTSEDERSSNGANHPVRNEKDGYTFDFGENFVPPTGL
jgi:hypothetical protein